MTIMNVDNDQWLLVYMCSYTPCVYLSLYGYAYVRIVDMLHTCNV